MLEFISLLKSFVYFSFWLCLYNKVNLIHPTFFSISYRAERLLQVGDKAGKRHEISSSCAQLEKA